MEWNDLRYVLAVGDAGSLAGAARILGVNHTTVLRRISAFEKELGLRLFERLPTGYVLTAGGEELIAATRNVNDTIIELERKLAGRDLRLSGALRVTTTDSLMGSVLPEILAAFRHEHPGIRVDVVLSNALLNLSKRDADVAIRPAERPPEHLIGRSIAKVAFAVYAGNGYLAHRGKMKALHDHEWIVPDDSLSQTSVARWMRVELPNSEVSMRADSFLGLKLAAEAGLGLAALPCYLGDTSPRLVCVHAPIEAMETTLWILTHDDLRHTARVHAFTQFAASAFARHRPLLEGKLTRVRSK
jgi:DNA-binding transcriptional LysR family regulator